MLTLLSIELAMMMRNLVDFIFDLREIMVGENYYEGKIELHFFSSYVEDYENLIRQIIFVN